MSERIQIVITTTPDVVQIATEGPQGPSGGGGGGGGNTNLSYSATGTTVTIASDTGTDATILAASGTVAGVMTSTQFTKLDGIASGATVGATWGVNLGSIPAVITGTTASFTTALESKLNGMDTGATFGADWLDNLDNIPSVISNTTASFTTAYETKLNGMDTGATFGADWLDNLDNIPSVVAAMTSQSAAAQAIGKEAIAAELLSVTVGNPKIGGLSLDEPAPTGTGFAFSVWDKVDQFFTWYDSTAINALIGAQPALVSGDTIKTINGASVLGSGDLTVTGGTKTLCRWIASEKGQPPASGFATLDTQNSVPYLAFADAVTSATVFQDWIPQGANLASGVDVTLTFAGSATSGGVRCDVAFEALTHAISGDSFDTVALGTATTTSTAWLPFSVTIRCTALDSLAAGGLFRVRVRRLGTDGADTYAATVGLLAVKIDQVA